jgi:multidrug efflux pump subunit AcrA (membrane-fusion protein)
MDRHPSGGLLLLLWLEGEQSSLAVPSAEVHDGLQPRAGQGYIAKRNVDIGDHVKQGELLAELAVPELVDQIYQNEGTLSQFKSTLEQAVANLKLAEVTWDRDRPLVHEG